MYYTKKIPAVSQNRLKELTIEFEGEFNCLGDMKKKIQKLYLKNYNLLYRKIYGKLAIKSC